MPKRPVVARFPRAATGRRGATDDATVTTVGVGLIAASLCVWNPAGYASIPSLPTLVGGAASVAVVSVAFARGRFRWSPIASWLGASVLVALAVSAVSPAPMIGIMGAAGRVTGVITRVLWLVAFLAGTIAAGTPALRRRALGAMAVGSWLFAAMTLLGRLGVEVVPDTGSSRGGGPLGSAAFTGGALVLMLSVNAAAALATDDHRWHRGCLGGAAVLLAALATTGARAAWLGAIVALPVGWRAVGSAGWRDRTRRTVVIGSGLLAVLVVATFATGSTGRLGSLGDSDGTAAGRVALWRGAVNAIGDVALVGTGPDQQGRVLPRHLAEDFERRFDDTVVTDRAHNEVLDMLLASGVAGVVVLVGSWWAVVGALRRGRPDPVAGVLAAGLLGYVIHLMFNFSVAPVDLFAWAVVGLATASGSRAVLAGARPVVITAAVGLGLLVPLALDVQADRQLRRGFDAERRGDLDAAVAAYDAARGATPWQPQLAEVVARYELRVGDASNAVIDARDAADRSGDDPRWVELEAQAMLAAGRPAEAEAIVVSLIDDDDRNASLFEALGYALADQQRIEEARSAFERALELNPRRASARQALGELSDP